MTEKIHKTKFTKYEIERLRDLIKEKNRVYGKSQQKTIRDKMRRIGFYITDYDHSGSGFNVTEFDNLIRTDAIKVEE